MKPKVFISRPIPPEVESYLAEHCEIRKWQGDGPMSRADLLASLNDAEGLLTADRSINQELLDHAPKLKVVSNISVGYNNFDLDAMKARGVMGTNTSAVLNDTVADLIFAGRCPPNIRVGQIRQGRAMETRRWPKPVWPGRPP